MLSSPASAQPAWGSRRLPREAHLYGDIEHESRLSRVRHAHHPDPVRVAHAHLLWKQRERLSTGTSEVLGTQCLRSDEHLR